MIPLGPREMPEARAASVVLVTALIRRIQEEGGHAMVLAKGDQVAGAILLILADRGVTIGLRERMPRIDGGHGLEPVGPKGEELAPGDVDDYVARRRRSDPDLWVVELDHGDAEAIAAGIL